MHIKNRYTYFVFLHLYKNTNRILFSLPYEILTVSNIFAEISYFDNNKSIESSLVIIFTGTTIILPLSSYSQ